MSTKALVYYGRSSGSASAGPYYSYITPKDAIGNTVNITANASVLAATEPASSTNSNSLCFEVRRSGTTTLTCYRITIKSSFTKSGSLTNTYTLDKVIAGAVTTLATGAITYTIPTARNYTITVSGTNPTTVGLTIQKLPGDSGTFAPVSYVDDTIPLLHTDTCAIGFDAVSQSSYSGNLVVLYSAKIESETVTDVYRSPQAMLSWSDDGGFTWKGERWEDMGKTGEYYTRMHWHRLGASRNRVFKMVISDPVKRVLIASHATIETERV